MRLGAALALSVLSAGLGASLVACFDLFHSTSGILDACQLDAEACNDAAPVDFCSWEGGTPQAAAATACAWINTCEGYVDPASDFGECMARALLVYDCQANPNNLVSGALKQKWIDLLEVRSCEDVDRAMFAPGGLTACPDSGTGLGCDGVTRVSCMELGGRPYGENCAMWGEGCDTDKGCIGCLGCFADSGAGACAFDASATCDGNVAWSCPNGSLEAIDCERFLQQSGTCHDGPLDGGDPTSPCYFANAPQPADAGEGGAVNGCTESCIGTTTVNACARGAAFQFDCSSIDASCQENDARASCAFPQDQ